MERSYGFFHLITKRCMWLVHYEIETERAAAAIHAHQVKLTK